MEWASNSEFEDHPSLVFLNRNLPVPKFTTSVTKSGPRDLLTLKTDSLTLTYSYDSSDPGMPDAQNGVALPLVPFRRQRLTSMTTYAPSKGPVPVKNFDDSVGRRRRSL
jgi:hypothetical protein